MGGGHSANAEMTAKIVVWGCAAVVAAALIYLFMPSYLNTDTAQYIVSARHLLRGDGFATSLIYFEQQIVSGSIPAPQTVWPPGYPSLIAVAMFFGVPFTHAPFLIALISHVLASLIMFALLRRMGCQAWLAAGGAVANLIAVLFSVMVLRGLSEPTYTLCTVLSAWFLAVAVESPRTRVWLSAAGGAAAMAFLIRYAGIAFVAGLGLTVAVVWLLQRSMRTWWDAVAAMAIPVAAVASLFLRNQVLVGSLTGGPSVGFGSSLLEVVRGTFWAFEQVFGVADGVGDAALLVAVLVLIAVAVQFVVIVKRHGAPSLPRVAFWVLVLSGAYVVSTVAMYGLMAFRRTPEVLAARYFLPLLPFLIIAICALVMVVRNAAPAQGRSSGLLKGCGVLILICFASVQVHAIPQWREWFRGDSKFATIIRAMEERVDGRTLRDVITEVAGPNGAVLAVDGQLLGMWLDRPAIGLSEAAWTRRTWTADEVRAIVRLYNVRVICEFPGNFDSAARVNRHRVFFIDLARGQVPSWLRLAATTESARLYEVVEQ